MLWMKHIACSLPLQGLAALAPGIAASAALRTLNLERRGISAAGCAALAAALAGSGGSALVELILGQNSLGADGLAALLSGSGLARLQLLDLSACGLESGSGVDPLAAALRDGRLSALTSLRLDGNELGAGGAAALAAGLAASALASLHLQRCGLGGEAAAALADALPAQLATLDLSGNAGVGSEGAAALAAALAAGRAPRLRRLLLCGCGLDDEAIVALADALAQRGTAGEAEAAHTAGAAPAAAADAGLALDLSGNTAGAAALAALAAAPLATLCLHDCKLGGSGEGDGSGESTVGAAAAAAAAVACLAAPGACGLLQELDVSGNRLQAPQLLALLQALNPGDGADSAAGELPCPRLRLLVMAANPGAADEQVGAGLEGISGRARNVQMERSLGMRGHCWNRRVWSSSGIWSRLGPLGTPSRLSLPHPHPH